MLDKIIRLTCNTLGFYQLASNHSQLFAWFLFFWVQVKLVLWEFFFFWCQLVNLKLFLWMPGRLGVEYFQLFLFKKKRCKLSVSLFCNLLSEWECGNLGLIFYIRLEKGRRGKEKQYYLKVLIVFLQNPKRMGCKKKRRYSYPSKIRNIWPIISLALLAARVPKNKKRQTTTTLHLIHTLYSSPPAPTTPP